MQNRYHYIILGVLLVLAVSYQGRSAYDIVQHILHGKEKIRAPFGIDAKTMAVTSLTPEAVAAGLRRDDEIVSANGKPYPLAIGSEARERLRPGDVVTIKFRRKGERGQFEEGGADIHLVAERTDPMTGKRWFQLGVLGIIVPFFCLIVGFVVAGLRPADARAWMLLGVMLSLGVILLENHTPSFRGWARIAAVAYHNVFVGVWPISMLLFGIHFPSRSAHDRRWPWVKWIFIVPIGVGTIAQAIIASGLAAGMLFAVAAERWYAHFERPLFIVGIMAVSTFFFNLGSRFGAPGTPDDIRRLKLLHAGCVTSMTPAFILLLLRLAGGPQPMFLALPALLLLPLFPLTLAYVIIVERAMDLGVVIRQGVQYALASKGVIALQIIASFIVIFGAIYMGTGAGIRRVTQITIIAVGFTGVFLIRGLAVQLRVWIDRRFFREAYNAELILSQLAEKVRTIVETKPLLETVAQRISESLHVPRVAFLLANDGVYQPTFAIGFSELPHSVFRPESAVVKQLLDAREPLRVYFDDPNSWIYKNPDLNDSDRKMLAALEAQILLPLSLKEKLSGFITLGPKQSEAPFSGTDVRLLQSVAAQTTLALENSHLTAAIAAEMAQRERINRELEIARDVQQHLFPQEIPSMPGLDVAGACRPALMVGGDYYDFIRLPEGRLGIAIGDISGKGVGAALLMASLQASLRGQTVDGKRQLTQVIKNVNRVVYETSPSNRYATFFYGEFDPQSRVLTYVNAGHNPPIVLRRCEESVQVLRLDVGGMVVGLIGEPPYEQGELQLQSGDLLIAFTDGVSEAMNPADEEWGENRLIEAAKQCQARSSADITRNLMRAADEFAAGAPQHDDMTLVVARVQRDGGP